MPNVIVLGLQWGDEGKGKIVDVLSEKADVVARYQGGHNAGIRLSSRTKNSSCMSFLPEFCIKARSVLSATVVVVEPASLIEEINGLKERGVEITVITCS